MEEIEEKVISVPIFRRYVTHILLIISFFHLFILWLKFSNIVCLPWHILRYLKKTTLFGDSPTWKPILKTLYEKLVPKKERYNAKWYVEDEMRRSHLVQMHFFWVGTNPFHGKGSHQIERLKTIVWKDHGLRDLV